MTIFLTSPSRRAPENIVIVGDFLRLQGPPLPIRVHSISNSSRIAILQDAARRSGSSAQDTHNVCL